MKRCFSRYILAIIAPLITFLILSITTNPAFLIVALMFIFIIMPIVLMFAYYFYGLSPRIVLLSAGCVSLTLNEQNVTVNISFDDDRPDKQFSISISQINEITPGKQLDTLRYGKSLANMLLIDINAFESPTQRILFHNYIFDNMPK